LIIIGQISIALAQNPQSEIDSLVQQLQKRPKDSLYVYLANKIAYKLWDTDTKKAIFFANEALETSESIQYMDGLGNAQIILGWVYYRRGEIDEAFEFSQKALKTLESSKNDSLKVEVLNNLAAIYNDQAQFEKSFEYFKKAYQVNQLLQNEKAIGRCLNNLAFTAFKMNDFELAQEYVLKSIVFNQKIGNQYYVGFALRTKGDILNAQQHTKEAIIEWKKAKKIAENIQNNSFWLTCANRIAKSQIDFKQYDDAIKTLHECIQVAKQYSFGADLKQAYLLISQAYKGINNFEKAFQYHESFFALHDSLFNEASSKKLQQLQTQFEAEKKENEILLLKAEQSQNQMLYEKRHQQQQWIIFSFVLVIVFMATIGFLINKSKQKVQKAFKKLEQANNEILQKNEEIIQQKEELFQTLQIVEHQRNDIEEKNKDIIDSINYAKRIQNAILPQEKIFQHIFPQSFIFNKPKDIVSGDFYWVSRHRHLSFLAVADCTGHGVSGAFMTLIGNILLNQIVNENHIFSASQILFELDKRLLQTLQQSTGSAEVSDGMDISLLIWDKNTHKISFSSAKRPLWYVQSKIFYEIKGSKSHIGSAQKNSKNFEEHTIDLIEQTVFYLFTDGYVDQFSEKDKVRIGSKAFKSMIQEIHELDFSQQKQFLQTHFDSWKGNEKQTDDVLVVVIEIG
jgi:tetratricopeptide (TPR) repeat protein